MTKSRKLILPKSRSSIVWLILVLGSMALLFGCASKTMDAGKMNVKAQDTARSAKVIDFSGQVTIVKAESNKQLAAFKGMSLTQGDRIITQENSSLILAVGDEKELRVSAQANLTIRELQEDQDARTESTTISIESGGVWSDIRQKLTPGSRFEIATPTAVMGVRGTKFSVFQSGDTIKLSVFEGSVAAAKKVETVNPDGSKSIKEIVKVIGKNQVVDINKAIQREEDFLVQPLAPEALDLFTLETVRELLPSQPDLVDPSFKDMLPRAIEEKTGASQEGNASGEGQAESTAGESSIASGNVGSMSSGNGGGTDSDNEESKVSENKEGKAPKNGDGQVTDKNDAEIPVNSGDQGTLPAGYPKDVVPIIPGATVTTNYNEGNDMVVSLIVKKDYSEISDYYRAAVQGAQVLAETESVSQYGFDGYGLAGERKGYIFTIVISKQEVPGKNGRMVVIGLTQK